ncbi:MAG: recombinase family protein [Myxococcales bacterium]
MITAVALLRVSTADQLLGLSAQKAAITTFADREGIQVIAWHAEEGSGGTPFTRRPVLQRALSDVMALKADAMLVGKRDRLSRDPLTALLAERAIAPARVLAADGNNGHDPGAKLMRSVLDAVAEFERSMISIRTKAALAARKAAGGVHSGGRVKGQVDTQPRKPRSDKGQKRTSAR